MSMALQARVSSLEAEVKALREIVDILSAPAPIKEQQNKNPFGPRQLCPKCGEKPNYYLHVKHCKGKAA